VKSLAVLHKEWSFKTAENLWLLLSSQKKIPFLIIIVATVEVFKMKPVC